MNDFVKLPGVLRHCNSIESTGCLTCAYEKRCEANRHNPKSKFHCAANEDAACAIEKLLAAAPNWVRVEDRLPDREGYYLVAVTNEHGRRYTKSAFFMGPQHGTWFARQKVTHWTMPLAPPEEATDDA